ncbi:hypothetical protein [Pseudoxanthomonas sp.]|uniref:hypothetical protein n=1 Tax=Pseudoxanthomonas sp. TaxID=1871049 RepID=UPI0025F7F399|nr:hypothetical protein [Pseudoxanthomonas sp.]
MRPTTNASSTPALDKAVWGLYADLIGKTQTVGNPTDPIFAKVEFRLDKGRVLEKWTWYGAGAFGTSETYTIEQLGDTGQLRFTTSAGAKWVGAASADGSVQFSKSTIVGKSIQGYYSSAAGIERRTSYRGKTTIELLSPFDASRESHYIEMANANNAEEQRSKAEAAGQRFQMVGALVNSAAQSYAAYRTEDAGSTTSRVVMPASVTPPVDSISAQAGGAHDHATNGSGSRAPSTDLRFVLSIGMEPMAGDRVNPTCYSNLISRPGPPGWGNGDLPSGSARQAHDTVKAFKASFINQCRATGRKVASEGNFQWVWNERKIDEAQLREVRPRYKEDVLVQMD